MKKNLLTILFTFYFLNVASQNVFQRKYYIPDSIYYSAVKTKERFDGKFVNMTIYGNLTFPSSQIHLTEMNQTGHVQWYKRYNDATPSSFYYDLDMLPAGELAVVGQTAGSAATLVLFDSAANMTGAIAVLSNGTSNFESIFHSNTNEYVMCGGMRQPDNAIVYVTDPSGNLIRENQYQINGKPTHFQEGLLLKNNNQLFAGQTYPETGNYWRSQLALLVTDNSGNPVWGLQTGDTAYSIAPLAAFELFDLSIIVVSIYTTTVGGLTSFPVITKLSFDGHTQWSRKITSPDFLSITAAALVGQDRIVLTGFNLPTGLPESAVIAVCDTSGSVLFTKGVYETIFGLDGTDITACADSGVIITASTPVGNGFNYRYLIKTDSAFNVHCNENTIQLTDSPISGYDSIGFSQPTSAIMTNIIPLSNFQFVQENPIEMDACDPSEITETRPYLPELNAHIIHDHLILDLKNIESSLFDCVLYDISGKMVDGFSFTNTESSCRKVFPVNHLASGMYIAVLKSDHAYFSTKIVAHQDY